MSNDQQDSRGRTLALGWAAAVAMWGLAYVAMTGPGPVLGEVLFAMMLLCPALAGYVAGRDEAARPPRSSGASGRRGRLLRGAIAGALAGFVTSIVNLLILGSLLMEPESRQLRPDALWWIIGNFVITIGLAKVGGMIGAARAPRGPLPPPLAFRNRKDTVAADLACANCGYNLRSLAVSGTCPECGYEIARTIEGKPQYVRWFNLFTRVAVVTVFLLLITGGLVTGLRAGLAVPDWPNSFGHNMLLYPLAKMTGGLPGVYYEHAHRLYGMLVGLTSITLAVGLFIYDRRGSLRIFGLVILAMVCVQGVLGGLRVTETSVPLAIIHGVFAQVIFASMLALAGLTSRSWLDPNLRLTLTPRAPADYKLTLAAVILLVLQIALGAMYRHLRRDADDPGQHQHALFTHIGLALVVAVIVVLAAGRAWAFHGDSQPILKRLGKGTIHTVLAQLALGVVAMLLVLTGQDSQAPPWEIALTTAHQVVGAALLGLTTLLMLWERRLLVPSP